MAFDDAVLPRLSFTVDPLRVAVAQIRFPMQFSLLEPSALAKVQELMPDLPQVVEQPAETSVAGPGLHFSVTQQKPARFTDPEGHWIVSVNPDRLSIETQRYPGWEDFRDRVRDVLTALDPLVPKELTRVGLRYVNELTYPGAAQVSDWVALLDPSMTVFANSERIAARVRRSLEHVTLDMGDDQISFRHGFVGPRDLRDKSHESVYLVDVDVYSDKRRESNVAEQMATFERYHQWAWTLFRGSIGPELVEALGGEPST